MFLVISSILSGYPELCKGIRVIPGKSTKVRSGPVLENIVMIIGILTMFLLVPATLSVNSIIFSRTKLKSVNF